MQAGAILRRMIDMLPTRNHLLDTVVATDPAEDFESAHRTFSELLAAVDRGTLQLPRDAQLEQDVRQAWSNYECVLEAERALDVLGSPDPRQKIEQYDLLPRYRKFLEADNFFFRQCALPGMTEPHLLMVGSGPLPITSYVFGQSSEGFGYRVTNVDSSSEALKVGQRIMEHAGIEQTFVHATGADVQVDPSVTSILVAALAGVSKEEKLAIIGNLSAQIQSGVRINVRYGTGVRQLFYPECVLTDKECDSLGLKRVGEFNPPREYMNSIGAYEKC